MSAEQIGEGTWTMVSIRHTTAARLRMLAPGGGYADAISTLFWQSSKAPPRIVTHLASWKWMAACGGCGWYRIMRGRRTTIDDELARHASECPPQ